MNLAEWTQRKRERLQSLRPPDIRHLVPTVNDFARAVSTGRQELAIIGEIARATPEEGQLAEVVDVAEIAQMVSGLPDP